MGQWFLNIDYWLLEKINQSGAFGFGDVFFPWITDLNKTFIIWIAVLFVFLMFCRKYKIFGLLVFFNLALALGWSDLAGSYVKNHYLRLRPFENKEIIVVQKSPAGSKSFYSNHTSNMFTFAAYTAQLLPGAAIPVYTLASLVAYSRIYNAVHYPSDVLAGGLAGSLWGFLFSVLTKKLLKNFKSKKENAL